MKTTPSSLFFISIATVVAAFSVTSVSAQTRFSATSSVRALSSSSSSKSSEMTAKSFSAPAGVDASVKISELPYCGNSKEDNALVWDKASKKWICKPISTLMPPKCDGADQALRYDGKAWRCDTVVGLLVAHTATFDDLKGKNTCDTKNTWGGATCTVGSSGMSATLKCPPNTTQVDTNALNGYELTPKDSKTMDQFSGEYHAFCFSRGITIAK